MGAAGFTFVESMVALVVLSIGVIGTIGMCEWAERGLQRGALTTTALALAESRLEAKRSLPWDQLLVDDLDQDGNLEAAMRDDGLQDDKTNGDGIFTASPTQSNIRLVWTVELNRGNQPGGGESGDDRGARDFQDHGRPGTRSSGAHDPG